MEIQIDKKSRHPINDQIKEQITGLILSGRIKTGDQLPTIRELAAALAVNVNTIALAYRDLTSEGVIITLRGKGTFIAATPAEGELQVIRNDKLKNIIAALLRETDRLGYHAQEVMQELINQVNRQG